MQTVTWGVLRGLKMAPRCSPDTALASTYQGHSLSWVFDFVRLTVLVKPFVGRNHCRAIDCSRTRHDEQNYTDRTAPEPASLVGIARSLTTPRSSGSVRWQFD